MRRPPAGKPQANNGKGAARAIPSGATGQGITVNWQERQPNGTLQPVLDVQAETGAVKSINQSGTLYKTSGTLYREGKPAATFTAPTVDATREKGVVIARNGVVVHSVDPAGVTVTADRVTWRLALNRIIAEGNVRITYQPPGAPSPQGYGTADHATIDTRLQRVTIP